MRRLAVLTLFVALLGVAVVTYARIGWWRMEDACSLSNADGAVATGVSYSWTWQPLGFTCTYADGTIETSLWF